MEVEAPGGGSGNVKFTGRGRQGSHNKPVGCGVSGAYASALMTKKKKQTYWKLNPVKWECIFGSYDTYSWSEFIFFLRVVNNDCSLCDERVQELHEKYSTNTKNRWSEVS